VSGGWGSGNAGGGAGGQYVEAVISVVPEATYTINIGGGGSGGSASNGNGTDGGDTWFNSTGTVIAKGGAHGNGNKGGSPGAGTTTGGIGNVVVRKGGNGSTGSGSTGGGGGGGAGTLNPGGNASSTSGGSGGSVGGGNGGSGVSNGESNGSNYGGGGSGGGAGFFQSHAGGNGAQGKMELEYTSDPAENFNPGTQSDTESLGDSVSSTASYKRASSDTETLSDAPTTAIHAVRNFSDTEALAGSHRPSLTVPLSFSDTETLNDTPVSEDETHYVLVADYVRTSDTFTPENNPKVEHDESDVLSLSDALSTGISLTVSDTVDLSESTESTFTAHKSSSDAGSTTLDQSIEADISSADGATSVESGSVAVTRTLDLSDSVTLSDSVAFAISVVHQESDSAELGDAIGFTFNWVANEEDLVGLSDSVSTESTVPFSSEDLAGSVESFSIAATVPSSDIGSVTEGQSHTGNNIGSESDTLGLSDSVNFEVHLLASDTVQLTDSSTSESVVPVSSADDGQITEAAGLGVSLSGIDGLSTVETQGHTGSVILTESDLLGLSDTSDSVATYQRSLSDGLALSDVVDNSRDRDVTSSDSLSALETGGVEATLNADDTVGYQETGSLATTVFKSGSDTGSFTESVGVSLDSSDISSSDDSVSIALESTDPVGVSELAPEVDFFDSSTAGFAEDQAAVTGASGFDLVEAQETQSIAATLTSSDTSSGDEVFGLAAELSDPDSASSTEAADHSEHAALSEADSALFDEQSSLVVAAHEAGQIQDNAVVCVSDTDSISALDAHHVELNEHDSSTSSDDESLSAEVSEVELSTSEESIELLSNLSRTDSGSTSEDESHGVHNQGSDSGSAEESSVVYVLSSDGVTATDTTELSASLAETDDASVEELTVVSFDGSDFSTTSENQTHALTNAYAEPAIIPFVFETKWNYYVDHNDKAALQLLRKWQLDLVPTPDTPVQRAEAKWTFNLQAYIPEE
jgi:hypothetical protein